MKHVDAPDLDRWDFWTVFDRGEWEPETLAIIDRFVTPGSMFLDIGAWIGPLSLYAAGRGASVVAVEPDPVAAANLRANVTLNNAGVLVIEAALAVKPGTVFLQEPNGSWGSSMSRVGPDGITVQTVTLDELDLTGCALAKMDIEGGELDLLPTVAPELAKRCIPLLISWHEPWWTHEPPDRASWFTGYTSFEGTWGGWGQLLCLP